MKDELKEKIRLLLEQPLLDEGCEIAEVVLSRYKNNVTLRLFVYCKQGTSIDECARLSRVVGHLVDGTDYFKSGYTLEVSSPGLDRPLQAARDFRFRIGETVKIEFVDAGRMKVEAEIVAATDNEVEFKNDDGQFKVGLDEIDKAKIIF